MSRDANDHSFRRLLRTTSRRVDQPLYETGDYTIPDGLDARVNPLDDLVDELFIDSDFDDADATTITRYRWR